MFGLLVDGPDGRSPEARFPNSWMVTQLNAIHLTIGTLAS
jgi:hypothetical protein